MAEKKEAPVTPLWEKLVGVAGFILLCIAIGVLANNVISGDESPPLITFENIEIATDVNGFRVDVEVVNSGGTSVSDLEIEGHVRRGDGSTEISSLRFDYLPAQSRRAGGLFFTTDPGNGNIELRPKSFIEP
jgi:uncharacterized protein (TIGR02588 family)